MAVFAEILLRLMLSVAFKAAYGVSVMRGVVIVLLIDVSRKLNGRRLSVALDAGGVLWSLHRLSIVVALSTLNICVKTSHRSGHGLILREGGVEDDGESGRHR